MIRRSLFALLLVAAATMGQAQEIIIESLDGNETGFLSDSLDSEVFLRSRLLGSEETIEQERAVAADGAVLRGLDRMNGEVVDVTLQNGFSVGFGDLRIDLAECRYPEDNPAGEAYAFLTIRDTDQAENDEPVFQGWMIASSPALNAMDHARYDVWVLRCDAQSTSESSGN